MFRFGYRLRYDYSAPAGIGAPKPFDEMPILAIRPTTARRSSMAMTARF
jgi:hypothetical protein